MFVAEAVKKLFVDLEVVVVDNLGLDRVDNDCQDFVHALPVAELRVVLRPQIEQIRHVLLGVFPCVELDILHRTLDVFLDDVSELALLLDQVDFEFLWLFTFLGVASDLIVIAVVRGEQLQVEQRLKLRLLVDNLVAEDFSHKHFLVVGVTVILQELIEQLSVIGTGLRDQTEEEAPEEAAAAGLSLQ